LADADATAAANPAEPNPKRELETSYRVSTEVVENKLLKDVVRPGGLELPTFWFRSLATNFTKSCQSGR